MLGGAFGWIAGDSVISFTSIPRPVYHYSLPIYLTLTLVLYLMAARLVRPARRWHFEWAEVVVAIVLLVGLFGSLSVGYAATTNRYENINIVVQPTATPFSVEVTPTINSVQEATPAPGESVPSDYPSPKGQKQLLGEQLGL